MLEQSSLDTSKNFL